MTTVNSPSPILEPCAVSVIIPAFNGARFIMEQLDALATQEFHHPWEVVVGENGSTDGTLDLLRATQESFPVPLLIADASSRPGASHARNAAVLASHGQVLAFCDCDDHVGDGWVQAAWQATRTADLVAGQDFKLTSPFTRDTQAISDMGLHRGLLGLSAPSGNIACLRAAFFTAGGFDESLPRYGCEDIDFTARFTRAGFTHAAAPDMKLYFRATDSARTTLNKIFTSARAESLLWQRFGTSNELPRTLSDAIRNIAALPWNLARSGLAEHRFPQARRTMREFVRRLGHVCAQMDYIRSGIPEPRLLSTDDDPMRGTPAHDLPDEETFQTTEQEHPTA